MCYGMTVGSVASVACRMCQQTNEDMNDGGSGGGGGSGSVVVSRHNYSRIQVIKKNKPFSSLCALIAPLTAPTKLSDNYTT